MKVNENPLSKAEFDEIFSKVPRLTVEILIKNNQKEIYLTQRAIEPCKDLWHLPGGTVRFGEPLTEAVTRIAKRELGINVINTNNVGYIEYPSHYLNGLDSPVGIVFEVTKHTGKLKINSEAKNSGWFKKSLVDIHPDQDIFLIQNSYLAASSR